MLRDFPGLLRAQFSQRRVRLIHLRDRGSEDGYVNISSLQIAFRRRTMSFFLKKDPMLVLKKDNVLVSRKDNVLVSKKKTDNLQTRCSRM